MKRTGTSPGTAGYPLLRLHRMTGRSARLADRRRRTVRRTLLAISGSLLWVAMIRYVLNLG